MDATKSPIDSAKARLRKAAEDIDDIGWVDADDVAAIRTVLDELERLQAFERQFPPHEMLPPCRAVALDAGRGE